MMLFDEVADGSGNKKWFIPPMFASRSNRQAHTQLPKTVESSWFGSFETMKFPWVTFERFFFAEPADPFCMEVTLLRFYLSGA